MMNDLFLFFFLFFFFLFFFLLFFLFFFLFFFFYFCWGFSTSFFIIFRRFWFSSLFAWSFTEPLGQFGFRPLGPFILVLFFPVLFKSLGIENDPTAFVQLSSVFVCSCVSSAFIFGVHADLWWILASKSFLVKP